MAKISFVDSIYALLVRVACVVVVSLSVCVRARAQDAPPAGSARFGLAALPERELQVRWPELQRALAEARVPAVLGQSAATQPSAAVRDHAGERLAWWTGASIGAFAGAGALLAVRFHDLAGMDHASSSALESARRRAPWLNGGAIALGALGAASLAGAIIDRMTLRSSREADAWTFRIGMPQVTLRRRF